MPTNKDLIYMELERHLKDTKQWGTLHWDAVLAYCIGYYDCNITMDHLDAIKQLELFGGILGRYREHPPVE